MPELPEVETISRDVRPHLVGARIERVRVLKPDVLRGITRKAFERHLTGRRFRSVGRRAKHVVMALDDGRRVVIQPRMTGSLLVAEADGTKDPYVAIQMRLESGKRLLYRDVRRLGAVFLLTPGEWSSYDAGLGPEPLAPTFTPSRLGALLATGRLAVKKALMDQRRLAGIGNIYANEALWLAGIDPSRPARVIDATETRRLHRAIVAILSRAIAGKGTTLRDYRTGLGARGRFQSRLAVYGRRGERCRRCGRRIVLTHAIDGRATYFCPGCQR